MIRADIGQIFSEMMLIILRNLNDFPEIYCGFFSPFHVQICVQVRNHKILYYHLEMLALEFMELFYS